VDFAVDRRAFCVYNVCKGIIDFIEINEVYLQLCCTMVYLYPTL
jgi:hypothetical protein